MDSNFILKGNICYSLDKDNLKIVEKGYLVCEYDPLIDGGRCAGVFKKIPEEYAAWTIIDYKDALIVPGLVDLHAHAPQYAFRGLGMDLELLDWLNVHTFPEEEKYADPEYAQKAYSIYAEDMKKSATTRAVIFATVHPHATEILMNAMEETGLVTYVGKVNMDRNAPDNLVEKDAEQSARDTLSWLLKTTKKYSRTKPILTPRFIPSCTDELMHRLKVIQESYQLPVQSHLSENEKEISWVRELCPNAKSYGDAYHQFGLFGGSCKTVMAHCVSSTQDEIALLRDRGVYIAHCPQSNTNLSSGIAPVRMLLDKEMRVGLGSDIAGGYSISIFRAMADAIQCSKLLWRLKDQRLKALTVEEAFYLGTKGGGAFFGKVGSFEEGYELDAVVMQDEMLRCPRKLSVKERLERIIYLSDDRHIAAKYVRGTQIL